MPKSTPHYTGHRQRLRERFLKTGFTGFRDYEALELLLFYALPRRDVKPIAKDLIKRFKSLRGVMDATHDELMTVKGISESAATFIKALKETTGLYLREKLRDEQTVISSTGALLDYCHTVMSGLRDEQFRAIYLNSQNSVIGDEVIQEGTVNQSVVYPRKVMERALRQGATALIFVHNHPGGSSKPSREDELITGDLVKVARGLDITVHDHLIVSREGYYSFRESGKLG
jgi:DNA repair protein RadC